MIDDSNQNQTGQNNSSGQGQADPETERRNRENESGEQSGGQSSTGFVGSSDDEGDFLTEGPQEFAPDGQGASDSNAGLSDIETGQLNENDNSIEGESGSDY